MRFITASIAGLAAVAMVSAPLSARQAIDDFAALSVSLPFSSAIARANLQKLAIKNGSEIPSEQLSGLGAISSISYSFQQFDECPMPPSACGNYEGHWVRIDRSYRFNIAEVANQIDKVLNRNEKTKCDKLEFGRPRLSSFEAHSLTFKASVSAKDRWCWGRWSGTNASGSGEVTLTINLSTQAGEFGNEGSRGGFDIEHTVDSYFTTEKIFGVIDPQTLAGKLVNVFVDIALPFGLADQIEIEEGMLTVSDLFGGKPIGLGVTWDAAQQTRALKSTSDFYQKFSRWNEVYREFVIDGDETKFLHDGNSSFFVITEYAMIPRPGYGYLRPSIEGEIRLIDTLSDPDRLFEVGLGDSLWGIASEHYGFGSALYFIASHNKIDLANPVIHPGEKIRLPAYWKLGLLEGCLIKPGDSLWTRRETLADKEWKLERLSPPNGSKTVDSIFPMQIFGPCKVASEVVAT